MDVGVGRGAVVGDLTRRARMPAARSLDERDRIVAVERLELAEAALVGHSVGDEDRLALVEAALVEARNSLAQYLPTGDISKSKTCRPE